MKRKWLLRLAALVMLGLAGIAVCDAIIEWSTRGRLYDDKATIPYNKVGLVLGTARHRPQGGINPYYQYRIDAALALYRAGKISFVLVSGDNGSIYYNEPNTIKKDLMAGGIPEEKIFLDYAGFRTLDSVMRARVIFGLDSVTVISQEFHNERAVYLAEKKDLYAIGFNARDIGGSEGMKVHLREYPARVKVFLDLLFNTQPRFYGNPIEIK